MVALARRAIACKGWRWLPGMLTATKYRACGDRRTWPHLQTGDTLRSGLHVPDLTDPATLGCLLALVREAWGIPTAYVSHDRPERREPGRPWCIDFGDGSNMIGVFESEAGALVFALESAP